MQREEAKKRIEISFKWLKQWNEKEIRKINTLNKWTSAADEEKGGAEEVQQRYS